ncbi:hypothetical protein ACNOYE_25885 [Nannocystaceae bacterium ST9]
MLGRCDVAKIETTEPDWVGTGFVIKVGSKHFLVTALHVVADATGDPIVWVGSFVATFEIEGPDKKIVCAAVSFKPAQLTGKVYDASHDWAAFEIEPPGVVLSTARSCVGEGDKPLSCYGFGLSIGEVAFSGHLTSRDARAWWSWLGKVEQRRCATAFLREAKEGVPLPGVSGAPLAIDRKVIGLVSAFYEEKGLAIGAVAVNGKVGTMIPGGTRLLRKSDGEQYLVRTTIYLNANKLVAVRSDRRVAAANVDTDAVLEFVAAPAGLEKSAKVVAPGIQGGGDEVIRATPAREAVPIGGIVIITPIEQILEKLESLFGQGTSAESYRAQARISIVEMLTSNAQLRQQIADRVDGWQPHASDAESLADAILGLKSPLELAERFSSAMEGLRQSSGIKRKQVAMDMCEVFERALPIAAGAGLFATIEDQLYSIRVREPLTAEVQMAWEDRGKIEMLPIEDDERPVAIPRHFVNVGELPESGMSAEDAAKLAEEDIVTRLPRVATKWLSDVKRIGQYTDPESMVRAMNNEMKRSRPRKYYTIAMARSAFVDALTNRVPELRIIVSTGSTPNEYFDMIAPLGDFYRTYATIMRESS